jgi:hypothetical protein
MTFRDTNQVSIFYLMYKQDDFFFNSVNSSLSIDFPL